MAHDHAAHQLDNGKISYTKAFALGIILNITFVVIEAGYGYFANSLSLMADAGHNLSDVLGLALAWGAAWLGTKKPSSKFTYGLGQTSILAALANAIMLLVAVGAIMWEAIVRLQHPEIVSSKIVIVVAAVGILINGVTALLFMSGRKSDLNIRGAYLHMLSDAAVSAGVVVAAIVISCTGWLWLDPVTSIAIGLVIVYGTWELLKDSIHLSIAAVPEGIEIEGVKTYLLSLQAVASVHDLHIWAMSTTENAMTAHLVIPVGHPGDNFIHEICEELERHFKIQHATIQIEKGDSHSHCKLEPDEVV